MSLHSLPTVHSTDASPHCPCWEPPKSGLADLSQALSCASSLSFCAYGAAGLPSRRSSVSCQLDFPLAAPAAVVSACSCLLAGLQNCAGAVAARLCPACVASFRLLSPSIAFAGAWSV